MKVEIKSRKEIEKIAQKPFEEKTALISITDFDYPFAELKNRPEFLLRIVFDDVPMADDFGEEIGHAPTEEEKREIEEKYHTLTNEQVHDIVDFYYLVKDKAQSLICQCEHGQSRSAAVAAAFMEYATHDGIKIFADDKYCPNKSVFRALLVVLRNKEKL